MNPVTKEEHVLVCLSSSPSNQKVIKAAGRMSEAFGCKFSALFVRRLGRELHEEDQERLNENIEYAKTFDADIETVYGDDIAFEIAEFCSIAGVTEIFIGRTGEIGSVTGSSIGYRLMRYLPETEIHIIPDTNVEVRERSRSKYSLLERLSWKDFLKTIGIMAAATVISYIIWVTHCDNANIITVFLLAVLLVAVVTADRLYSMLAAVVSILMFNFLFTEPQFSMVIGDPTYIVTYFMLFVASLIVGNLASKLKENAVRSAQNAFGTRVLLEASDKLQTAGSEEEIIQITCMHLLRLLHRTVLYYPIVNKELGEMQVFVSEDHTGVDYSKEKYAAEWTFHNNRHAGATTSVFPDVHCLYLAVRVGGMTYGVIGVEVLEKRIEPSRNHLLLSMVDECALSIANRRNTQEREKAELDAEKQRFRADLLRSVSHDLRTPLTSISGDAINLLENGERMDAKTKKTLYADIRDDSEWLQSLVENLLAVTKLQEGASLHRTTEIIEDVIQEAMRHIDRRKDRFHIEVDTGDEIMTAKIDVRLIQQVIINLVNNAIKYCPEGSTIKVKAEKVATEIKISVADNGPGISEQDQEHMFEMFYTGVHPASDSYRSLGLGLSLCRSIVEAHGGTITVSNLKPHGCIFEFTLKGQEVTLDESM